MELAKLEVEYLQKRHDPNYQHRDMEDTEFMRRAEQAFGKLPPAQQESVWKAWQQFGDGIHANMLRYRYLAQTNLFFLCHLLEKYNQATYNTHEYICNGFFVAKDPSFLTFEQFANQYTDLKRRMLLVPRNGFKALDLDTEIPTPEGMRLIRDIKTGDIVFSSNGKPCNVIGESSVFTNRECYEVRFSTGESIIADADHLWVTDSRKDRDRLKGREGKTNGPKPSVKTTKEILDTLMCRKEHNHRVLVAGPLEIKERTYTISPYALGCWLGDGTSSNSNFTCADEQIVEEIRKEGEVIRKAPYDAPYLYLLNGGKDHPTYKKHSGLSFSSRLRGLGLIGNKHIPEEYFLGSFEQRLALLQGLMDTDGTCNLSGQSYFSNKNKTLVEQVRRLVSSLGIKPFAICEFEGTCNGVHAGTFFSLGFKAFNKVPIFRLKRKLDRLQCEKKSARSGHRTIVSVERVDSRPTKCIAVDSPDRTYLVGQSHIVTHNSSLDMADVVQYIVCFPEITILIMTGTLVLATDFVGEVKGHFTLEPTLQNDNRGRPTYRPRLMMDKTTGAWTPSMFQVLFAEHCVPPDDGKRTEFNSPACSVSDKEPSVRAASIEQTLSGMHFGVLKLDDVVTNENSQTPTRIATVNKQISINRGMLNPYGFVDVIGTWYDEHDFYGETLKNEEKRANEDGKQANIVGTIDSGRFDSSVVVKTHLRACWWPTEAAQRAGKIEAEMTADDYVFWFPERLNYEFLRIEQQTDEFGFAIKYLNNPRVINRIKFPRELMVRKTIPSTMLPHQGMIVTVIDTAYSTQAWADYTVIVTALIYGGRFYVINMRRGRYNEYQLPQVIAEVGYQWKPKHISIEESVGVAWLQREIRREMAKLRISIPITLVSLGKGSKSRNKAVKAKPLARLLGDDRFYFTTGCEGLQEIYNELEQFTGTKDDKHDDIVSALSLLVEQYAAYAEQDGKTAYLASEQQFVSERQAAARYRLIHGLGEYSRYNAANDDNPRTAFDLGQAVAQAPQDQYWDPLADAGISFDGTV